MAFAFTACHQASPQQQQQSANQLVLPVEETNFQVSPSNINLSKPLEVSTRPADVAVCEKINQTIEQSAYSNARWGVTVISLKDGRVTCDLDGRKLFNPASIEKTLTAIVGLDKLGADFRWKTSAYAQNQIEPTGILNGDLILYGQGAPDFNAKALETLVADLQAKGLKHVKGNIIGDESFFKGPGISDGWTWNELQWYYGAEASALSYNGNEGFVSVENGIGRAATDYLQITVAPTPTDKEDKKSAGVSRGLEDNNFYMWGANQNWGARVAVHNPAGWAAKSLKESLQKYGITVGGESRSIDWKSENKLDTGKAIELASVEGQTLGEIVQKMNKHSVNLYGELILRMLGKRFGDYAPDEDAQLQVVRGDGAAGAAVIKKWLREHNVATDEIQIHDGSGLSRLNFVSPEAFGRALIAAAQSNYAASFVGSLPVAATDGTLGGRLGKVKGKVLAKTGSITFVNSLTGYAEGSRDENFAFAIICNNQTRKAEPKAVIDSIATIIVSQGLEDAEKTEGKDKNQNSLSENKSQKEEKPK